MNFNIDKTTGGFVFNNFQFQQGNPQQGNPRAVGPNGNTLFTFRENQHNAHIGNFNPNTGCFNFSTNNYGPGFSLKSVGYKPGNFGQRKN